MKSVTQSKWLYLEPHLDLSVVSCGVTDFPHLYFVDLVTAFLFLFNRAMLNSIPLVLRRHSIPSGSVRPRSSTVVSLCLL
jgi:hypothetical protein